MTTLTEFLEARIAEDEAMARSGFSHPDRWVRVAPAGIPNGLSCSAVLAECETKRRIIDHRQQIDSTGLDGAALAHDQGLRDGFTFALRYLAQPHADHPDFDPSWRVQ
jgi:hypothetical protein